MAKSNWFLKGIRNPKKSIWVLFEDVFLSIRDDESFIRFKWAMTMNYPLSLKNPTTFNEKLNWLKLYDRQPEYTRMVDKILVKEMVAAKIGSQYIIPTLGVWNTPDEIDFDLLPEKFVLKCNHNSGRGMVICKDKGALNKEEAKDGLWAGLKEDYYLYNREWPYKNVVRRILAEEYMEDESLKYLRDYKFFCFNGVVKALFIATNRHLGEHATCFDFFDENFNHLPFTNGHPNAQVMPEKPRCFEEMKQIASVLSLGIPCSRIDLYEINGKVYFGEITFTHWGGFVPFNPPEWDTIFGNWVDLSQIKQ